MREIRTQLAVIGGGPAGVCAALSAARHGVRTVLVTNRPVLGGNSSSEIRVWTRGATGGGNLYAEEMGVWGELKLENLYRNPEANPVFWDEVLLDSALKQENLELYLNTEVFTAATREDGGLACVYGVQQGSERRFEIHAELFIDATGDGVLGEKAGVPFEVGNGRRETLGSSILYYTRREPHPVPFIAPDYAYSMEHIEKIIGCGGRVVNERMSGSDCWWFEYGGLHDTIADAQDIALELRRLVMGVWNYIKNSGKFDAANYTLDWLGAIPGKRESRRMKTEYRLTREDILAERTFPDGAFYGGWYMDVHPSGGMYDSGQENCVQKPVRIYQIPLRCLFNRGVPNLLFAGRLIGVERDVFFSSRIMNTCALSGQAAAALAAECLKRGKPPALLTPEEVEEVRLALLRDDMLIPGAELADPADLAPRARASASSAHRGLPGAEAGRMPLDRGGFLMFPACPGGRLRFEVSAERPGELRAVCASAKLPNCLDPGRPRQTLSWALRPGTQTVEVPVAESERFVLLSFPPAAGAALSTCARVRTGFLCGQSDSPDCFEPRAWYEGETGLYAPERAVRGESRPWGGPNVWLPEAEDPSPWLELTWEQPVPVREVRLCLDPDLATELPSSHARNWERNHRFAARRGMPPQLVRDLTLTGRRGDGRRVTLAELREQHQRLVVVRLPEAVPLESLRLEPARTWGGLPPAVYQIRVYSEITALSP